VIPGYQEYQDLEDKIVVEVSWQVSWLVAIIFFFILIIAIILHVIGNRKRRREMVQKLSEHLNVTLVQDYSQTMDRMRKLFINLGDKYACTASNETIVSIFIEALLKQQLRGEEGIGTGSESIC